MLSQTSFGTSIGDLITVTQQAYELILENRSLSAINSSKDVIVEIVQIIQDCSQFIIKYSETRNFCALIISVIFIALSSFLRVLSPEECSTGDSYQSRQL